MRRYDFPAKAIQIRDDVSYIIPVKLGIARHRSVRLQGEHWKIRVASYIKALLASKWHYSDKQQAITMVTSNMRAALCQTSYIFLKNTLLFRSGIFQNSFFENRIYCWWRFVFENAITCGGIVEKKNSYKTKTQGRDDMNINY